MPRQIVLPVKAGGGKQLALKAKDLDPWHPGPWICQGHPGRHYSVRRPKAEGTA
jgi:hypothetical protein